MGRSILIRRLAVAVGVAGSALSGCSAPAPSIREGNADSVTVGYGGDIATAGPLARRHCAQYERVPEFVYAGIDFAVFDCIRR